MVGQGTFREHRLPIRRPHRSDSCRKTWTSFLSSFLPIETAQISPSTALDFCLPISSDDLFSETILRAICRLVTTQVSPVEKEEPCLSGCLLDYSDSLGWYVTKLVSISLCWISLREANKYNTFQCTTSEDAVMIKPFYEKEARSSRLTATNTLPCSSSHLMLDSTTDHVVDDSSSAQSEYPWAPTNCPSPCRSRSKRNILSGEHPWTKLIQDDEPVAETPSSLLFSNVRLVPTMLFHSRSSNEKRSQSSRESSSKKTPSPALASPPVKVVRRNRSDSGDSEVSCLSNIQGEIIEFSLEHGLRTWSREMKQSSESMLKVLQDESEADVTTNKDEVKSAGIDSVSPECLILLMNPRLKIFEIVRIRYEVETTTVGELLSKLKDEATDPRLARQSYTGLAYQGLHISAPMVPIDILLEAEATGKPLFAVPQHYSAGQIECMANELLKRPQVIRLLESQHPLLKPTIVIRERPVDATPKQSNTMLHRMKGTTQSIHDPSQSRSHSSGRMRKSIEFPTSGPV